MTDSAPMMDEALTDSQSAPPPPPQAQPQQPQQQQAQQQQAPQQHQSVVPGVFPDPRRKRPLLASFLSLMPGLGQIYVGYYQRGFTNAFVVAFLITMMVAIAEQDNQGLYPFLPLIGVFLAFYWLYNIVDAGRRAALYNQALAGGQEIELPSDFAPFHFRGSIAGGAALMVFGFILLLNTRFNVSLDWVAEWWPGSLILLGGYLMYKAINEKANASQTD